MASLVHFQEKNQAGDVLKNKFPLLLGKAGKKVSYTALIAHLGVIRTPKKVSHRTLQGVGNSWKPVHFGSHVTLFNA